MRKWPAFREIRRDQQVLGHGDLEEQIAADAERGVDRAEDAAGGEQGDGKPRR